MDRRTFLAAAGTAAVAARPSVGRAQALTTLRIASAPNEDILAALWAEQTGGFRKVGLDASIQKANSGSAVASAVIGGSVDIGKSSMMALIIAHAKGIPLVLAAPAAIYTSDAPTAGMLVAKDSGIKTARDLAGKTIGVSSLDDLYQIGNSAWIDANGGDAQQVHFIELPTSATPAAVAGGRVAAATISNPTLEKAIRAGGVRVLCHPLNAIANRFIQACYFCTADFARGHEDVLRRFRGALYDAAAYVNGHPAETLDTISTFTKIPPNVMAGMTRVVEATSMEPALIQPVVDAAVRYHAVAATFEAQQMIDPGALKQ